MVTYYSCDSYNNKIYSKKFERVTAEFGFKENGRREKLRTGWISWYPTVKEALHDKRMALEGKIGFAEGELTRAKLALASFEEAERKGVDIEEDRW